MNKVILHIDMDAFFASVEQASNPKLKGKPLIVGGRGQKERTVVTACSYEAKAYGIESGMSCVEAFRLCPRAEFVVADSSKYLYASDFIFGLLKNYSPNVEAASVDEFYLDITGLETRFGSYEKIGILIKDEIKNSLGITGSVGISETRLFSKIASKLKKPDGLYIMWKKDIKDALRDLPIQKIPGIGKALQKKLNELNVFKFSDLSRHKRHLYYDRFGKVGLWIHDISRGEDADWVSFWGERTGQPKSIGHSYTLPHNIYELNVIRAWIRMLSEMVATRLRRESLEAKTVHLFIRKPDFGFLSKQKSFEEATSDGGLIFERALLILKMILPERISIRALGLSVSGLNAHLDSYLFENDAKKGRIFKNMDFINDKFGEWSIYPASISFIVENN